MPKNPIGIVAGGRDQAIKARVAAEVWRAHASELKRAGLWGQILLKLRIRREIAQRTLAVLRSSLRSRAE